MQHLFKQSIIGFVMYFCIECLTVTNEISETEDLHVAFLNKYRHYRLGFGCKALFCRENQEYNSIRYLDSADKNALLSSSNNSSETSISLNFNGTICCSKCSCETDCERQGNCCPDRLTTFPYPSSNYPLGGIFECAHTSVKEKPRLSQRRTQLISKCSQTYNDIDVIQRCESSSLDTLETYIIVSHKLTKDAYKNIYCARCNYIADKEVIAWIIKLECEQGAFVPNSLSTIVTEMRQSNHCNMIFTPPSGFEFAPCKDVISKCNVTGLWQNKDTLIEKACDAYTSEFRHKEQRFKNEFCFVCNSNDSLAHECPRLSSSVVHFYPLISFAALLDFKETTREAVKREICPETQIFDHYKKICRDIICPVMSVFYNGSCKKLKLLDSAHTCFEATIKISSVPPMINDEIHFRINKYFGDFTDQCRGIINYTILPINASKDVQTEQDVSKGYYIIHLWFTNDTNFIDSILELDRASMKLYNNNNSKSEIVITKTEEEQENFKIGTFGKQYIFVNFQFITYYSVQYKDNSCSFDTFVISELQCPTIELNLTDFLVHSNESGIFFKDLNLFLSERDLIRIHTNQIRVCAANYIPATKKYALQDENGIKAIVTFTCVCCSIVCLIITITFYGLFPVLRTQPGINNMTLSVSLLLAYICLMIGGVRTLQRDWCTIIGIFVHFLWLNSIFWLNICCFHMFKTFGYMRMPVKKSVPWLYHAYSLTASTVLININILWSLCISDGDSVGYGKHDGVCYIRNPRMIAYTMTLPAFLVVVSNLVMYVIVVVRISRNSVSHCTSNNRSNYSVYLKLSTVTGLSWLSYIPVYLTGFVIFNFLYSVLLGCEGIFIMLAFVCNKRVIMLCKLQWKEYCSQTSNTRKARRRESPDTGISSNTEKETITTKL